MERTARGPISAATGTGGGAGASVLVRSAAPSCRGHRTEDGQGHLMGDGGKAVRGLPADRVEIHRRRAEQRDAAHRLLYARPSPLDEGRHVHSRAREDEAEVAGHPPAGGLSERDGVPLKGCRLVCAPRRERSAGQMQRQEFGRPAEDRRLVRRVMDAHRERRLAGAEVRRLRRRARRVPAGRRLTTRPPRRAQAKRPTHRSSSGCSKPMTPLHVSQQACKPKLGGLSAS